MVLSTPVKLVLFAILLAAAGWAAVQGGVGPAELEDMLRGRGAAAPAVFVGLFALATLTGLPGSVFALAGGALFGPVSGTLYNLSGATLGATAAFLAARYLAADGVRARTGPRLGRLVEGVEAEGWRFIAFVRLVPLFPFNLINYALGLTRIGLAAYVAATFVCMIPGALAYTWLGHVGREALAGGEGTIQKGLLGLGLLASVLFLPRLVRRFRKTGERLDIQGLRQRLTQGDDLLVLDVRDAAAFAGEGGHVPGAVNIPLPELEGRLAELGSWRERPLAVLCQTDKRSAKAVEFLKRRGFRQVLLVEGGMREWGRQGLPVEQASPEGAAS